MARKPQELDELDDDLDEDESSEEELEDDESQEAALPPAPAVLPQVSAPTQRPAQAHPRRKNRAKANGLGAVTGDVAWKNKDADLMIGEMLERLNRDGHSPYELSIGVLDLNPSGGGQAVKLGSFEMASVVGDQSLSPGDALTRKVEDDFHLASGKLGGGLYELRFMWKVNSQVYGRGRLSVPPRDQLLRMRASAMQQGQPQPGFGQPFDPWGRPTQPPQGFGSPPPGWGYGPPPTWGQPSPYYAPPPSPAAPQGMNPDTKHLVDTLINQLNETRNELAQMRKEPPPAPVVAPPSVGVGAPPQASLEETVTRAVSAAMGALLPHLRPQQSQSSLEGDLTKATSAMLGGLMQAAVKRLGQNLQQGISQGLGAPVEMPAPEDPETELVPPPDPSDDLPFKQVKLEATWPDGRNVYYPAKKEDGSTDWLGALFTNPWVTEKLVDNVNNMVGSVADAVKRVGVAGPHIVHHTPKAAQDATPQPEAPKPGLGSGGWDE
jgi:hypothetical protein